MSLSRDQIIASNTNLLPGIPLKKRKVTMLHASMSLACDDDGDDKTHTKNRTGDKVQFGEHLVKADLLSKGDCGSFSSFDYDEDDDDDDDTLYTNPYLQHVRSSVEPQQGEASHSCVSSFVRKGSNHMLASDINEMGHNARARHGLSSYHKYVDSPHELCDITSYFNKYPFSLTSNEAENECSELSRDIPKDMWLECGLKSASLVSSLMLKETDQPSESVLNENSVAHAGNSSAPHKYFSMPTMCLMRENENSGILGHRPSSMRADPDPMPSSSSKLCEDLFPLKNANMSLSAVGTSESAHSSGSGLYNKTLFTALRTQLASSVKSNKVLLPNYNSDIKPKPVRNQTCDLPSSLTLHDNYHNLNSEFSGLSRPSDTLPLPLQSRESRPVVSTSLSSSPELPEREPYSNYKCDIDSKTDEKKSAMMFIEHGISPDFNWKNSRENRTAYPSVPEYSSSAESCMNVERFGDAGNSHKKGVRWCDSDMWNMLVLKTAGGKLKLQFPHTMERTSCSETHTAGDIGTVSKQGPSCSYEGSQRNLENKVGENVTVLENQCQGTEADTKEECHAVGNILLTRGTDSCALEDPGILPVKSKGILNVVDCHHDVRTNGKKSSEADPVICVDDIQYLKVEQNKHGNSDNEEAILVSDDSDDDIEIVKCLSKSNVGKMNFPVQQKALDFTKNCGRYKNRNFKDNSLLSFSTSFVKRNRSSSSNHARNFMYKQAGDKQLSCLKSVPEVCASTVTSSRWRAADTPCLDMRLPAAPHKPQTFQSDDYDLSYIPVNHSVATPSSPSPMSNGFKFPGRKRFPGYKCFRVPYAARPLDLASSGKRTSSLDLAYPLSSEIASSQYAKKQSFAMNLVHTPKGGESGVWNPHFPNSSSDNAASSSERIESKVANWLQTSIEPSNQKECSVLPKDMSQPMPVLNIPLDAPGVSCNMQEGEEVVQKQQSCVEDETETRQRNSRPEWECAICLETLSSKRGISATTCGHVYCTACITEVVRKNKECPTCRRTLDSIHLLPLFISG